MVATEYVVCWSIQKGSSAIVTVNVLQHCLLMTVGDASYAETKLFFETVLRPDMPEAYRGLIDFEHLFDVFGGKLAHWSSFISDFVNADGKLELKESSHYIQAYALLNLQLVHSMPNKSGEGETPKSSFPIYSSVPSRPAASSPFHDETAGFTADNLLYVMRALKAAEPTPWELLYFPLCRQLGADIVDAMVRGRILELRWTPTVTVESRRVDREPFIGRTCLL